MITNIDRKKLAAFNLDRTDVDITKYGFKEPRFNENIEAELTAISDSIFQKRKPYIPYTFLSAFILPAIQMVEFSRQANKNPLRMGHPHAIVDASYTTKQIVHVGNGGTIDNVPQSDFRSISTEEFSSTKIYEPAKQFAQNGLILRNSVSASFKRGESYRYNINDSGVWVFLHLLSQLRSIN